MILKEFNNLVDSLTKLPGISRKQATKIVNYLLINKKENIENVLKDFLSNINKIKNCSICGYYSIDNKCEICNSNHRENKLLIIENCEQIEKYENWKLWNGKYFKVPQLFNKKFEKIESNFNFDFLNSYITSFDEIVIALSPTPEGVLSANYIFDIIKNKNQKIKISKLAIGVPMGATIDYMDQLTLSYAIKNRKDID